ncbi:MAG: kynureninase [Planctomycetota bacterium]
MSNQDLQLLAAEARRLDAEDPLGAERANFAIPAGEDGAEVAYFCGNSLGLMPRSVPTLMQEELDDWARMGVEGHQGSRRPWYGYHEAFRESGARLVGGRPGEVVMMNGLTTNIHLMLATFYQPAGSRTKIMVEDHLFPSDDYAVESHIAHRGLDPREHTIRVAPRPGEAALRTEDVLAEIERAGPALALVMLSGVNYLTGQWFDMPAITEAGHRAGARVGWDLAHAAGNVPLELHDWDADFAVWCSYKYLNAGPGAVAGCFVHEQHGRDADLPRLAGWWGNDPETRFRMETGFVPRAGADGWQQCNPPIFSMTPLLASLEIFDRVGMPALRAKSLLLTGFLERTLAALAPDARVLTPADPARRGCQLSVSLGGHARAIQRELGDRRVVADFREPDVVRLAPVPLYNSFADVVRCGEAIAAALGRVPARG